MIQEETRRDALRGPLSWKPTEAELIRYFKLAQYKFRESRM